MITRKQHPPRFPALRPFLCAGLAAALAGGALAVERKTLETDVPPERQSGRTFVPLRAAAQALGAQVDWKAEEQTVEMRKGTNRMVLKVGDTNATLNGKSLTMDAPAYLKEGRVLVPLRFAAQALQVPVRYTPRAQTVLIGPGSDRVIWELKL